MDDSKVTKIADYLAIVPNRHNATNGQTFVELHHLLARVIL